MIDTDRLTRSDKRTAVSIVTAHTTPGKPILQNKGIATAMLNEPTGIANGVTTNIPDKPIRVDTNIAKIGDDKAIRLQSKAAKYWLSESTLPDSLIFARTLACVEIALLHSPKAHELFFNDIVPIWGLDSYQALQNSISAYLPNHILEFTQFIYSKENLTDKLATYVSKYTHAFEDVFTRIQSDWDQHIIKHHDLLYSLDRINELIFIAFNRQIDQDNKKWKITPEKSPGLIVAIICLSASEYSRHEPHEFARIQYQYKDNTYDLDEIPLKSSTRMGRSIGKGVRQAFKQSGMILCHDGTLIDGADMWYRARVSCNTAREAASFYKIDPIDLSKRIKPYDEATGWPRHR
ncbi:hypothetical protein ACFLTL_01925 [Chloroflexota bacterium]